jgi:hypothetical protein
MKYKFPPNESGGVLLEFIFYFPILFLAFFTFIIAGMLITQRAVMDRAVALAVTEASAWLSSDMLPVQQRNFFDEQIFTIRANPYADMGRRFGSGVYRPMTRAQFDKRVEEIVRDNVGWGLVGGWVREDVQVYVAPINNNFFAVDLTVTATQRVSIPFVSSFGDMQFQSTSTVRVFRPHNLMNDVHFVIDATRMAGLDVRKIKDYMDRVFKWADGQK